MTWCINISAIFTYLMSGKIHAAVLTVFTIVSVYKEVNSRVR